MGIVIEREINSQRMRVVSHSTFNTPRLLHENETEFIDRLLRVAREWNELIDLGFDPKDRNQKELFNKFDIRNGIIFELGEIVFNQDSKEIYLVE